MNLILLVDSHYLAWRAFYTTGGLSYSGNPTGVLYGFLRDVQLLAERFNTQNLVFCFDGCTKDHNVRRERYADYKLNRMKDRYLTKEKAAAYRSMDDQVRQLREILPEMGFRNVYRHLGYEADDIVASVCLNADVRQEIVIVSGDQDLYQLLRKGKTSMFDPRGSVNTTYQTFQRKYGISPLDWPLVKAMAGCKSDNIKGVFGVGEKIAIRYIRNELDEKLLISKRIAKSKDIIENNLALVSLPYFGCLDYLPEHQPEVDERKWREVTERYGMKSLRGKFRSAQKEIEA